MVVNSKIRDSDWLTFALTIVNFNHVFIQRAPELQTDPPTAEPRLYSVIIYESLNGW